MAIIPSDTQESLFDPLKEPDSPSRAIVRPSNPPPGIAGFMFDIKTDDEVSVTADVTDHYVENNSTIQDHIALAPEQVTLRGLIGEVRAYDSNKRQPTSRNVNFFPPITPFYPDLTLVAFSTSPTFNGEPKLPPEPIVTEIPGSLYDYFLDKQTSQPNQTKQAAAFNYFYQLYKARELFTVETPWGTWTSMAILSLKISQGEDTKYVSDMTIAFKKVRFAADLTISTGELAGRSVAQRAPVTENGKVGKKDLSVYRNISDDFYTGLKPK
jgi:hypothetical protein